MTIYSQKDSAWASEKINGTNYTIGKYGCFPTSLAIMCDKTPHEVNEILSNGGGYNGALLISNVAASLLDLDYNGVSYTQPDYNCIAETDYYKSSGYPQHFFVMLTNGQIIDPLYGTMGDNKYINNMVSYRLFKVKESTMANISLNDMVRNIIYTTYRAVLHEPTEEEISYWAKIIMEKQNDDYNFSAIGGWLTTIIGDRMGGGGAKGCDEFNLNWILKKEIPTCVCPEVTPCPDPLTQGYMKTADCKGVSDMTAGELILAGIKKLFGTKQNEKNRIKIKKCTSNDTQNCKE